MKKIFALGFLNFISFYNRVETMTEVFDYKSFGCCIAN